MKRLIYKLNKLSRSHLNTVMAIAIAVSLGIFAIVTWNIWQMYGNFRTIIITEFELQKLTGNIVYLDEVLTMSARLAATTGNLKWEERYRKFEPELDAIINRTIQLAPTAYETGAMQTNEANLKLVEMEEKAFDLVRKGRRNEALELLFSQEYERQKILYSTGINATISAIENEIEFELNKFQNRFLFSGLFSTISLGLLALAWVGIIRFIRQYISEQKKAKKSLNRAKNQLKFKVEERTVGLTKANEEITALNQLLTEENLRLNSEIEVTRKLQQMLLPKDRELSNIPELDIAGFMEPAAEVGGDYYDVLSYNGKVKIGIGDVTGHGLESGVLMIMVQTAVRTLLANDETDPAKFLNALNRTIYDNVQRMNSDKNLTLVILDYQEGILTLSGQHEHAIVVYSGSSLDKEPAIELIDTIDLGFPIGLEEDIADFVAQKKVQLNPGDLVVLYTDGITEAENQQGVFYGLERLCEVVKRNWCKSAADIRQAAIADVRQHIGSHKVYDDITLVVLKKK